jgi:peptide/nickel transport system permease protein
MTFPTTDLVTPPLPDHSEDPSEPIQELSAIDRAKKPTAKPTPIFVQVMKSPTGAGAIIFLVLVIAACFAAPLITVFDPVKNDLLAILQTPTALHWLGTDELGRDVLTRLLYGGQLSFTGVGIALSVALVLGVPVGIIAGFFGGFVDGAVSRVVDVMLAIPGIIILLMVLALFGQNQNIAMLTLGVLFAPGLVRIARSVTLSTREELYVAAARVAGLGNGQIMWRHILPRIAGPIIVNASLLASSALLVQTGLSFLGLGVTLPNPSWGSMVAEGGTALRQQGWLIIPSGLAIAVTVLAFVLLGDAIRDAGQDLRSSTVRRLRATMRAKQNLVPATLDPTPAERKGGLSVRDLSISLPLRKGWTTVVDRVSFDIAPGETLGLVGESGCGKTVTALSILGLVPAEGRISSGSIWFEGDDLTKMSPREISAVRGKRIGFISQEPMVSLDPSFTVGSQLLEAVRQHEQLSKRAAMKRVIELLESTGMPEPREVAKRYPHQISGGMAQRVVIARALAGRPSLLVADEPTTALDSTVQREILAVLRKIQRETGMAIILVTHDWGVVAETCDRAVVMYAGQVVEESDIRPIFRQPLHPYTVGLLGANPHLVKEGERITTIEGTVPSPANWPVGCRFADRCPLATQACRAAPIPLFTVEELRESRCIRIDALRKVEA